MDVRVVFGLVLGNTKIQLTRFVLSTRAAKKAALFC